MAFIFRNHPFLSIFLLVITYVTLAFEANAQAPATAPPDSSPFCDPDGDLVLCNQVIKNSKTWEEAMTMALNAAIDQVVNGQHVLINLDKKMAQEIDPEKRNNIVTVCTDGFDTVLASLKESLPLVTNDPTLGLNNKVSAAFSGFGECIDVLTEEENQKTDIAELTGLNITIQQSVYICLMVANRDPRVKNYYQKLEQGVEE